MPLGEGIGVCRGMVWLRIRRVGIGVVDGGGLGGCGWGSGVTGAEALGFTVARGAAALRIGGGVTACWEEVLWSSLAGSLIGTIGG